MTNETKADYVEIRSVIAVPVMHNPPNPHVEGDKGSLAFQRHGPQSIGIKCVKDGSGLPANTSEACAKAAKKLIGVAAAAELPCSGVYFRDMTTQPATPADMASALAVALEHGNEVWLSHRGNLTVGVKTKPKAAKKPKATNITTAQAALLAAFLKA